MVEAGVHQPHVRADGTVPLDPAAQLVAVPRRAADVADAAVEWGELSRALSATIETIGSQTGSSAEVEKDAPTVRVAIAGIRGIPANFGGSETATEKIGERLAQEGVDVTVYCRRHISPTNERVYKGMRRVILPSISTFQLDTISHSILATLHFRFLSGADVIHYHGVGNGLVLPLLWGSRKRAVITIDGPDWLRPKWGRLARLALRLGARLSVKWADELIIDNHPSVSLFEKRYGARSTYIPYGADRDKPESQSYLDELGLAPRGYILFVGALVPDKGADLLLEAYAKVDADIPLVVVGDSPFAAKYGACVRELASKDPRVQMLGYVRDEKYRQLVANAQIYVHPLRSDGTSPALLQAMGYGNCIVINSVPETLSAIGDAAAAFRRNDPTDLAVQLGRLLSDPELVEDYRARALNRATRAYNWDAVSTGHLEVFHRVVDKRQPSRLLALIPSMRARLPSQTLGE